MREQTVLLCLVQPVHLVHEEHRSFSTVRPGFVGLLHGGPNFLGARLHRRKGDHTGVRLFRKDSRQVVLPDPGGPQNTRDCIRRFRSSRSRIFPGPSKCPCPTNSPRFRGRILSANGAAGSVFFSKRFLKNSSVPWGFPTWFEKHFRKVCILRTSYASDWQLVSCKDGHGPSSLPSKLSTRMDALARYGPSVATRGDDEPVLDLEPQ